jgi:uncharacterized protein YbaR (Trm112 family)
MVDKELLDILICPACGEGSAVLPDAVESVLVCTCCGRRYPVREGIPVMLADEADIPGSKRAPGKVAPRDGAVP